MKNLKIHLLCICVIALTAGLSGCGNGGESTGGASRNLRAELREKARELESYARENGLYDHPAVEEARTAALKASREFSDLRRKHPELKPLFEKSDELKDKMVRAKVDGDEELYDKTMDAFAAARAELEATAARLPELQEAKRAAIQANRKVQETLAEVAAEAGEQGKKLGREVRDLLAELGKEAS